MSVTTGFLIAPSGSPNAQAVQADPTIGGRASCTLIAQYWPVGTDALGTRDSFAAGVPFRCAVGQTLILPKAEAAALVAAGAATWS